MGIVDAVKKGFSLAGKLRNVILIFFGLNVVMGLISLPLASPENTGNTGIAALSFVLSIVFFLIFIFLQGGALGLVKDLLKTNSFNMANFQAYGKKYYLRILGLLLLYVAIALALVLILGLIGSGIITMADNVFVRAIVGTLAGAVALMAIVALLFPIYSIVVDEIGTIDALKKGVKMGLDNFLNTLGIFLLLVVISIVISLAVGFVIGLVTIPLPFTLTQIIITIVNSAVQSYIPIVMMLALMVYYLGLNEAAVKGPEGPAA